MTDSSDIVDLADLVEYSALRSPDLKVTASAMRTLLPIGQESEEDSDDEVELLLSSARSEIRRRSAVHEYPFALEGKTLKASGAQSDRDLWEFLVTLSLRPEVRTLPRSGLKPSLKFERISREALARYTCGQAHVLSDLARGIRPAIEELGRRLRIDSYPHLARAARKDHGLDVVAWREFRHLTHGFPTILCQCTVGRPDLVAKACDTRAGEWARLLALTEGSLTTALAIPHVIPADWDHWFELKGATELILDRLRIWDLLSASDRQASDDDDLKSLLAAMRAVPGLSATSSASGNEA